MTKLIAAASLLAFLSPALAFAGQISYVPEPAWVKPIALPATPSRAHAGGGDIETRLIDIQVNRAIDPPEVYRRNAIAAVNELGVPEISQIECSFNPAYETLQMHRVVIHRGAQTIAVPLVGHVKVLHREDRLEDQIYDGELTAVLMINDVRPGDVVEASYTVRGANPVLAGHYTTVWSASSYEPIGVLHRRLLWPAARPLRMRVRPPSGVPAVARRGDVVEYDLLRRDVAAVEMEPMVPSWYDPFGSVRFDDTSSWNEVARWAATLFRTPGEFSPALRAKVAEFKQGGDAMAAIRFVQDEVRYLGIEIGENSHRATDPNLVLSRRFGDCKDKAWLLATFLRALGYEAEVALVNSAYGDSTGASGPSALEFDHVIVRFWNRGSGATYWVDATAGGQRGSHLADLALPRFGTALIVDDATQGLTRITSESGIPMVTIEKHIDAANELAPARLEVKSSYFGADANLMRMRVRAAGREQVEKDFLDYYRKHYPKIESAEPVAILDDEAANRIRIEEHYSIPGFWDEDESDPGRHAEFSAFEIMGDLPQWSGGKRTMPLEAPAPHKVIYSSSIRIANLSHEAPREETFETRAIRMTSRESTNDNQLEKYVEIETRGGFYTPEEALAAAPKFRGMEKSLSLQIGPAGARSGTSAGGDGDALDLLGPLMFLLGLALGTVLVVMVYRAPSPKTLWIRLQYAPESEPWLPGQPIAGWLYLLTVGILVSPFTMLLQAVNILSVPLHGPVVTSSGLPSVRGLQLLEAAFSGVQIAGMVLLVVLLLQRRRKFFRAYIGVMGITLVFLILDSIGGIILNPDPAKIMTMVSPPIRAALGLMIWSSYFVRSRRAEATFVN